MKKYFLLFLLSVSICTLSTAQVICIFCYDQNDSISDNVNNLILNGGFENTNCIPNVFTSSYCPNSNYYSCTIPNWICTGGGSDTYASIDDNSFTMVADGSKAAYFGNGSFASACSPIFNDTSCLASSTCEITTIPNAYPTNDTSYGGSTGVSLEQTVSGLTIGNTYVLEFWAGGEPQTNGWTRAGVFAVDVGFGNLMLRCKPTSANPPTIGTRFLIEFNATSTSHTIKFTNWGHICIPCTELILDNIRLYTLAELSPLVPSCTGVLAPAVNIASSDTTWCDKKSINFFDLSTNNPTSWQWYFPGAVPDTSTSQNPTNIYYAANGSYPVTLVACNNGGCDSLTFNAFVNELPAPAPVFINLNGDTLCVSTYASYQWYEVSNPTIILSTDSCYFPSIAGNYFVLVTDSNGCEVASSAVAITTGIIENKNNSVVKIKPNPFQNITTLEFKLSAIKNISITIYDVLSREIKTINSNELKIGTNKLSLDFSELNSGIYFLKIHSSDSFPIVKIIKQ